MRKTRKTSPQHNGRRRCNQCERFERIKGAASEGFIGKCLEYDRKVIDCLCGCEVRTDRVSGKKIITLWNFGKEESHV